jgi:arylformamidase
MKINNIRYLSHPYTPNTPSYGDRDRVEITPNSSIEMGDTANSSRWLFTNNHIGTHVDVPFHFDLEGKKILDYSPEEWIFQNVALVDVPCDVPRLIDSSDLVNLTVNSSIDLLLIRTGYENFRVEKRYWNENPGLAPSLPNYLRERFPSLRCIGFDFISITSFQFRDIGKKSHQEFLSPTGDQEPMLAIEDMSLVHGTNSIDWVIVSPLLIENGNGSPVTVFSNMEI